MILRLHQLSEPSPGNFGFEFYAQKAGEYRLKKFFQSGDLLIIVFD